MTLAKFNERNDRDLMITGFNNIFETIFNDSFTSDQKISNAPAVNIGEIKDYFLFELGIPIHKKERL
ncbi:hypothetical protein [Pedobacter nyackensis]|uniref:hypothetical protein n=1 Tax=Pedobacter nyackensis TaxID=475255 RepID=UPI00292FC07D|nr:hypothetical protein [Pedobacter nyackensis]